MARQKVTSEPKLQTQADADLTLATVARTNADLAEAQAELDQAILDAKASYGPAVESLAQAKKGLEHDLAEYAEAHKAEWEAATGRRSLELPHGTLAFRKTSVLETQRGFTWKRILDILLETKRWAERFVRSKPQVDREALKAAIDAVGPDRLSARDQLKIGVRVVEQDSFSYDATVDATARTAPAAD